MQRVAFVLFVLFYAMIFPGLAKADQNWKQVAKQLANCAHEENIECALDLAEKTALSLQTGEPFGAGSLAPAGPVLISSVIAQRVSRGQMREAEKLYEIAFLERREEGFNTDRPIIIAQRWLAAGYLQEGSVSQFNQMIENSFGYDGKIIPAGLYTQKVRSAIELLNECKQPFDQAKVAQTILQWISNQEQKQEAAERVAIIFVDEGNYEAADIILSQYDSAGAQSRLVNIKKLQEKSETIARLLKNGEASKIITLLKQGRVSDKIMMSDQIWYQVKRLSKLYGKTDRSELIPPLLLVAGTYGSGIKEKVCKSEFTKRIIHLALNYENGPVFKTLRPQHN